jgi:predicted secreted acid phosphatase
MKQTAEEFLIQKGIANPLGELWRLDLSRDCYAQSEKDIQKAMIEFAKLHVEAALKEASKKARCCDDAIVDLDHTIIDAYEEKDSILNSYSLENIK